MSRTVSGRQFDLFLPSVASESERLAFLSTCPWLDGAYRNKLWRHSFHALSSYPSKLRPQIASFFIEYLSRPGDVVVDPMAGSGTVPLQACLSGREGVGIDLSPYAFLLIRAKVQPLSLSCILERIRELEKRVSPGIESSVPRQVKEFFHARTLREITSIRRALDLDHPVDSTVLALLCGILHGGRPGFLSRRSRDIIPILPAGPYEYRPVIPRLQAKANRVYSDGFPSWFMPGEAYLGDCRDPDILGPESADLILTSPPFFEHTEFVRHNWLRLWLVGWDLDEQKRKAVHFVGEKASNLPRFGQDIQQLIRNAAHWLKPGAYCVVHGGRKRGGDDMSQMVVEAAAGSRLSVLTVVDERADHSRKHAIRKISGESHNFVVLRKRL